MDSTIIRVERADGSRGMETLGPLEVPSGFPTEILGLCRIGTWSMDQPGGHLTLDPTALNLLEISREGWKGKPEALLERVHPGDKGLVGRMLVKSTLYQKPFRLIFRVLDPHGLCRWMEIRGALCDKNNNFPYRWSGILQDISDHQGVEENLFEKYSQALDRLTDQRQVLSREEELSSALLENTTDAILLVAPDGAIRLANSAAGRLFGRLPEGTGVADLFFRQGQAPEPGKKMHGCCEVLETILTNPLNWFGRSVSGEQFPVELQVKPLGDQSLFLLVARDSCHQRWLEAEVEQAELRERHAIACDLHDSVCQDLTIAGILVQSLIQSGYWDHAARLRNMTKLYNAIAKSQEGLRRIMARIKPMEVPRESLPQALKFLAEQVSQDGGLSCQYSGPSNLVLMDDEAATILYMVAREAVNNAIRHSGAKKIEIQLRTEPEKQLTILDDGNGLEQTPKPRGLGFHLLKEKAKAIRARLTIGPAIPKGTVVSCTW